jgi:protein tyrosine phosphatase
MKSIATQGPLTSTFYNLFRMIEKHNVTSIFMLCSLMEKNKKKCDRYWPILETETGKMT